MDQKVIASFTKIGVFGSKFDLNIANMDIGDYETVSKILRAYGISSSYRMVSLGDDMTPAWPRV